MLLVLRFNKDGPIPIVRKIEGWALLAREQSQPPLGWVPDNLYRSNIEISGDTDWIATGDVYFFRSESFDTTVAYNLYVWVPMAFLGTQFQVSVIPIEINSARDSSGFLRTPPNYQDISFKNPRQ